MTAAKSIAHESFRLIETGDAELAERIIAIDFVNEEAKDDPDDPDRQQHGPDGFLRPVDGSARPFRTSAPRFKRPSLKAKR